VRVHEIRVTEAVPLSRGKSRPGMVNAELTSADGSLRTGEFRAPERVSRPLARRNGRQGPAFTAFKGSPGTFVPVGPKTGRLAAANAPPAAALSGEDVRARGSADRAPGEVSRRGPCRPTRRPSKTFCSC
jgi:hypothetical protein